MWTTTGTVDSLTSIGLFKKGQREQASTRAMMMIAGGMPNVFIEIEFVLGRPYGFWASSYTTTE
jgi:hypothetical protein